jgi:hypothetical protein
MRVEFLDPARAELAEAITYYNNESEGLGYRFGAEVRRTISRITRYSHAWPALSARTRRCRTIGFPYGII